MGAPPVTFPLDSTNLALPKAAAKIPLKPPVLPAFLGDILKEGAFDLPADQRPKPLVAFGKCKIGVQWHHACVNQG
eukprot:2372898-Amphidinium_carterae.1